MLLKVNKDEEYIYVHMLTQSRELDKVMPVTIFMFYSV